MTRARTLAALLDQPQQPAPFVQWTEAQAARERLIRPRLVPPRHEACRWIETAASFQPGVERLAIGTALLALVLVGRGCWPVVSRAVATLLGFAA